MLQSLEKNGFDTLSSDILGTVKPKNEPRIGFNSSGPFIKKDKKTAFPPDSSSQSKNILVKELANTKPEEKKRGRKSKKQVEKELLNEYYMDVEKEKCVAANTFKNQKKIHENIQYLSPAERVKIDEKFTAPKNGGQEYYVNILKNKTKKIVIATGPAGTGKTLFATEYGVKYFLQGVYEKLIFTRPSVSVDEELGFLPGTLEDKMAPWVRPIYDVLHTFISPKEVQQLVEEKIIEIAPLGYMRGRTFKNAWIVADEMQNSSVSQMKMLLTRLGENSRIIITGDLEQYDRPNEMNGLEDFLGKFKGKRSTSITNVEFDRSDIQREDVVREILDIYSRETVPETDYETSNIIEDTL